MTSLSARDLRLVLGNRAVLDGITLAVDQPGLVGIVGPNGAGKTSLLRTLTGLAKPVSGRVELDGVPIASLSPRDRARRIGYLPQTANLHWPLTVGRLVALGRLPHLAPWAGPGAGDRDAIDRALKAADLSALVDRSANSLSGGELARALLARVIAGEPDLILADEPVASLDPLHQLRVMDLFRTLAEAGRTIVIVLHDLTLAVRFCDRLVLLDKGRIVADDAAESVAQNPALETTYGVQFARPVWADADLLVPWRPGLGP
ncbi:MAG: ABC transporter ATP-binding protein [Pseudomonadota bacterium]